MPATLQASLAEQAEQLQQRVAVAKAQRDLARLTAQTHALEMATAYVGNVAEAQPRHNRGPAQVLRRGANGLMEAWGDRIDRAGYLRDGKGASYFGELAKYAIARPDDFKYGDFSPWWRSEAERLEIVGQSRISAGYSEVAIAALENLVNYTLAGGFTYKFAPSRDYAGDPQAAEWARICQRISDTFDEANSWTEEGERELFLTSRTDGEFFAGLRHRGGLNVELVALDTSTVTEPDNKRALEDYLQIGPGLDWKYGVASPPGRSATRLAWFTAWNGDGNDWEVFHPHEMVHLRVNVPRLVKRGMPDFFPVQDNLNGTERLLRNTVEGAAVQAAIAYIREHAPGVPKDAIEDLVADLADFQTTDTAASGRTRTRNIADVRPGTVEDVTGGMKYHEGPMGTPRGTSYVQIIQAALRQTGIRWTMPEYMISGDASNNAYASTLAAESPFTRSTEARQRIYTRAYREIKWKAVGLVAAGLPRVFRGARLQEIKQRVDLTVDAQDVAVRDEPKLHDMRASQHAAGFLSLDTWATEEGRDLTEEQAKGAKPQGTAAVGGLSRPAGIPAAPAPPRTLAPMAESWLGYP